MLKVNDVITILEKNGNDRYFLVLDRPYEGNEDYLLKEITFMEAMSNKDYRFVMDAELPEHYKIQK